jgi:hypothetical protein
MFAGWVARRIVELLVESLLVAVRTVSTAREGCGTGCGGSWWWRGVGTLLGPEATRECVLVTGLRGGQTVVVR